MKKPAVEYEPLVRLRKSEIEREVAHLKKNQPPAIRQHSPGYTEVGNLKPIDNSAFEILTDDRVVDLRGWKDVPSEKMHELFCFVSQTRRIRLKKIKSAEIVQFQGRTTGLDLFSTCLSPYAFQEIGQIGEVYVGTEPMKARRLVIDVSSVPQGEEIDLRTLSSYWNTFQTESELWFGVIGYTNSFKVSMLLMFPPDKPFREYSLLVAKKEKELPVLFEGDKILLAGPSHEWIYWEVPNPVEGHVYQLHWKW